MCNALSSDQVLYVVLRYGALFNHLLKQLLNGAYILYSGLLYWYPFAQEPKVTKTKGMCLLHILRHRTFLPRDLKKSLILATLCDFLSCCELHG